MNSPCRESGCPVLRLRVWWICLLTSCVAHVSIISAPVRRLSALSSLQIFGIRPSVLVIVLSMVLLIISFGVLSHVLHDLFILLVVGLAFQAIVVGWTIFLVLGYGPGEGTDQSV